MSTTENAEALALVIVQLVVPPSLSARVPAAVRRGTESAQKLWARLVEETHGKLASSDADGWVASWRFPPDAARCALRLQEELLEIDWPPTLLTRPEARPERNPDGVLMYRGLRARVGIHFGWPEVRKLGADRTLHGPVLHQLARIASTGHGGQTLLSGRAWRVIGSASGLDVHILDLGAHRAPGNQGMVHLYQALPPGLEGRSFGPLATLGEQRTNVVPEDTTFLGREGDLSALSELFGFGVRLVTVAGARGIGKSRLVQRFAWLNRMAYAGQGEGGVWVIDLDEAETLQDLITASGQALDIPLILGATLDDCIRQIGYALQSGGRQLVVLDGIDRVVDEAREVLVRWMARTHETHFLVSARTRLGITGEVTYDLDSLPLPEGEGGRHVDSIRLLEARARATDPTFGISDLPTFSRLVHRLRGNPLAIELAASTLASTTPSDLLEALPARSVRRLVHGIAEQTWKHLNAEQRKVLGRVAVYRGAFDLRGAEAVCDLDTTRMSSILRTLVARGLVRRLGLGEAPGIRRFALRRPIRDYAWARNSEDQRLQLWSRYGSAILERCHPWLQKVYFDDDGEILARLMLEWENLLAIARWGLQEDVEDPERVNLGIRAVITLQPLLESHGPFPLQEELLNQAVHAAEAVLGADPIYQVRVLHHRAQVRRGRGQGEHARQELERGRSIARRWSDLEGEGLCLYGLSEAYWELESPLQAAQLLEDAARTFRESGNRFLEAQVTFSTGLLHLEGGRLRLANDHLHLALSMFREVGAKRHEAVTLGNLGVLNRRQGQFDEARSLYRQAIHIHKDIGDRRQQASLLGNLGVLDYHLARMEPARERFREAREIASQVGDLSIAALSLGNLGLVELEDGYRDECRQVLLSALALAQEAQDRGAEGMISGYLALFHHRNGRAPSARDYYHRSVRQLEEAGHRRSRGLFLAWLAVLEAEQDEVDKAESLFELAKTATSGIKDPSLHATLRVLRIAVDFARARDHAGKEQIIEASRIWKSVESQLEQLESTPIENGDLRLAETWLRSSFDAVGV